MSKQLTRSEFLEEVEFLLSQGVSPFMIAEQLGLGIGSVERRLRRYGLPELACRFQAKDTYEDLRYQRLVGF